MPAPVTVYNFTLIQGETWEMELIVHDPDSPDDPLDITGWAARCQFRVSFADDSEVIVDVTAVITDGANGKILLSLTASQTADIEDHEFHYDAEVESDDDGRVIRVVKGLVTLDQEVTR